MRKFHRNNRPGVTLVELLLFIAIIAILGASLVPLLFSSTESRMLQDSMSQVETNGSQLMQIIGKAIRESDRILDPPKGGTKSVLALQTASGGLSPTVFGVLTGALLRIQKTQSQRISGTEVSVENFSVQNTGNGTSTGVTVSFTVARTIRLSAPRRYSQTFRSFFSMYPKDILNPCTCELFNLPVCTGGNHYNWYVNADASCESLCAPTQPIQLTCS